MFRGSTSIKGVSLGSNPIYRVYLGNNQYYAWNAMTRRNVTGSDFNYKYGDKWELSDGKVQWNNNIFQFNQKGVLLYYNTPVSGCIFKMWCGTTYGTVKVGLVPYITNKTVSQFDESDFIVGWVRRPDQKCVNVVNGERTGVVFDADRDQVFFLDAYMGYGHTRVGALQTTEYRSRTPLPAGYINSAFLCVVCINDAFANCGADNFQTWWSGTYNV
jgi:hypothetical protein